MIDLTKPDLRKIPIGERVKTAKGFVWQLKERDGDKETWLDETTKITWHDPKVSGINHYQAIEMFQDKLPTKEEFEVAEEHGVREVMDLREKNLWSSSVHPKYADGAFSFYGSNGHIGNIARSNGSSDDAALCVER